MGLYSNFSDTQLVDLIKSGDEIAFTEIHHRYYGILYSHAYRKLQNREEVKDVLQEVFTNIWNNRENQIYKTSFASYLYISVRNRILNVIRLHKMKMGYQMSLEGFIELGDNFTDSLLREHELIALIEKEVSALPKKMRLIFEMSRNHQLSHKEIAEELKISPATVKKQVNNALKTLRVKLGNSIFKLFF